MSALLTEEGLHCLLSVNILAADRMMPNKLKEALWNRACWLCWKNTWIFP